MTTRKKLFSITLTIMVMLLGGGYSEAQVTGVYNEKTAHNLIWASKLEKDVEFYCDSLFGGRATGTMGGFETSAALMWKFENMGLLPLGSSYARSFRARPDSTVIGHNVIGMLPGSDKNPVESYIIIMSHYDNLGTLNGKIYPGADSNASGLVALTSLAEMFSSMKKAGKSYGASIIFVALDGSQLNRSGAYGLWEDIEKGRLKDPLTGRHITADKLRLVVNIDQIGSSLAPLKSSREDFLIMLGTESLPKGCEEVLSMCNRFYDLNLELSKTYYGSENFTRLFYTLSDQAPFVEQGFPAVMFTSGITMNTNRTYDIPSTLNYPVLRSRILLIYHWTDRMCSGWLK